MSKEHWTEMIFQRDKRKCYIITIAMEKSFADLCQER